MRVELPEELKGKAVLASVECPLYHDAVQREQAFAAARSELYQYALTMQLMLDAEIRCWIDEETSLAFAAGTIVGFGRVSRKELRRLAKLAVGG